MGRRPPSLLPLAHPSLLRLLLLCLWLARPSHALSSLCRSNFPDPGAFSNEAQCNDKGNDWPVEYQQCLPETWGVQCAVRGGPPLSPRTLSS